MKKMITRRNFLALMMFTAANIAIPSCNQAQDVVG